MAYTSTIRRWWAAWWKCNPPSFPFMGRSTRFPVEIHDAIKAAERTLKANGYLSASNVGSYYPRPIGGFTCDMENGGRGCSLHGYGLAFDIDPALNPYYRRQMSDDLWARIKLTIEQVRALEAIRTNNGQRVWRWLGWSIGDTMHFQVDCSPADMATGINWNTVPDGDVIVPEGDDMFCKYSDGFGAGNSSPVVEYWQEIMAGLGASVGDIDGKYGADTANAVKSLIVDNDGQKIGPYEAAELTLQVGAMGGSDADAIHRGDSVVLR